MTWEIVVFATYGILPIAGGLWAVDRWRSGRRNRDGRCAVCAIEWGSSETVDRYVMQGRLLCRSCARTARRRLAWHFAALGLGALLASAIAVDGADRAWLILFPPAVLAGLTYGAVRWMTFANRRAQRRLVSQRLASLRAAAAEEGVPDSA